jgi:hypothetical protein
MMHGAPLPEFMRYARFIVISLEPPIISSQRDNIANFTGKLCSKS